MLTPRFFHLHIIIICTIYLKLHSHILNKLWLNWIYRPLVNVLGQHCLSPTTGLSVYTPGLMEILIMFMTMDGIILHS